MSSLINEVANKLVISKIEGLSFEIKDCLECNPEVKDMKFIKNDDNIYYIRVYVDKFNMNNIHNIFKRFANFINYCEFSIYERDIHKDMIEYNLISSSDRTNAFHCKIEFMKYNF